MVPLYQWRGNLLILVVLTIQLSVLSLNIMIFKIRFIHKCLQLLYLNSFQSERPVSFVFKSCKFTCRKIATMIFKSDILITYVKEVKVPFSRQIQLADLIVSLHLSLGCIRGLNKSVTPRELLELILSGWHQKGPLLMVPPPKSRWFYSLMDTHLNKGCSLLRDSVGRDIQNTENQM